MVSDTGATFFSGRLGDRLDVRGRGGLERALDTASADDIFDASTTASTRSSPSAAAPSPVASGSGWSWPGP